MQNRRFLTIACFTVIVFAAALFTTVYAENVDRGEGNWEVTTDDPNPDPAGGIDATGGDWVTIYEGAIIDSPDDGVECTTDGYDIANNGTIGAENIGIRTLSSNTITNNGTIEAGTVGIGSRNGNTITNNGTIDAGYDGITVWGNNNNVTNTGTINAENIGIYASENNTITNEGTIETGDYGIVAENGNTITNSGTIEAGDYGNGIYVFDGNTITNSGTIAGYDGIHAYGGNTITNSGTIIGESGTAVYLHRAGNKVRLMPGSTTIGNIEVYEYGGANTVELNGSGSFADQFVDNSGTNMTVQKTGNGTWALTNTDITPTAGLEALEINQGTLRVDGELATLGYLQATGAILSIGVEGTATSGHINAMGAPTFNNGDLKPVPTGYVPDGATYTVMSSMGEFDNYFGQVVDTAVLDFSLNYPMNTSATVTVNRLTYAEAVKGCSAGTGNQMRIGENLDETGRPAGGDMGDVLLELDRLPNSAELTDAMDQMSPEPYGGLRDVSMGLAGRWGQTVRNRLRGLRTGGGYAQKHSGRLYAASGQIASDAGQSASSDSSEKTGIWARAFGLYGEQDAGRKHFGYDYDAMGITLGGDYSLTRDLVLGMNMGISDTDVDYDTVSSKTEADTFHAGLYGSYSFAPFTVDALLSWSRNRYDSHRYINFGGISRRVASDHDADEYTAYAGLDYSMSLPGIDLVPEVSLQYSRYDAESFTEHGAGALDLHVSSFDSDSVLSRAGVTVSKDFKVGNVTLIPEASAFWAHEFADTDRKIKARFTGGNAGAFTVEGAEPDRDSALLGAGLNINFKDKGIVYVRYDGEIRDDFDAHRVSCGVKYMF